jgi:hypothetical protein
MKAIQITADERLLKDLDEDGNRKIAVLCRAVRFAMGGD